MNYGAIRLDEYFVKITYELCRNHDVPVVADEIQTGIWSPHCYMFREYGVQPSIVTVGKGFPGGEYPASRILFGAKLDTLPQFGSLVTNGQEELSSLSYLVTMRWAEANAEITSDVGTYYEDRLRDLSGRYPRVIRAIEGRRHLAGIHFHSSKSARAFGKSCTAAGLDISAPPPKPGCPPTVLTKLPLIAGYEVVDAVLDRMEQAIRTC
jgi:acetylornithine/succinyldiaminopimelate/putrescine aminotransferase